MLISFISDFITYCQNLDYAESSITELNRYLSNFNHFVKRLELKNLSQIDYAHLVDFVTSTPKSPNTAKARIWTLKKFFQFLMLKGYVKTNIARPLPLPKIPQKEASFLNTDELKIIFEKIIKQYQNPDGLRNLIIFALMAVLGFRRSTVAWLKVQDLDLTFGRIFVREKGLGVKRPVIIPYRISLLISEYLAQYDLNEGPLFFSHHNKALSSEGVYKIIRLMLKKADCPDSIYPHMLRHSAATQLNEIAGFEVTKEMLGHKNPKNTQKYIHLTPSVYGQYMKRHPFHKIGVKS